MKAVNKLFRGGVYETPETIVYALLNEGMLCASGSHDPFIEDDDWVELLDD